MIPVHVPSLEGNEARYLAECIETGWISSEGPFVRRLEEGMAGLTGRRHAVAVCNGSAALDAAVAALRIGPGDEVILPTFTIISCALPVVRAGATPVVVDSDPDHWNMDVGAIEDAVTERTRAVMPVHVYGLPVDMDPLLEIAARRDLRVIEDAAEQIGQTCAGRDGRERPCGGMGDVSTFSFYPNKHVTTGEGGMVLTDDDALGDRLRSLRNLCFGPRRFVHEELGYNFRMSNLQAAVGVAQLERLEATLARKREIGRRYSKQLAEVAELQLPLERTDQAENVYWVYGVVLDDAVPFDAAEAMGRLRERGIGTRPFFWGMHEQPVFRRMGLFRDVRCPVAERLARRGFYLPGGLALEDDQIDEVVAAVKELFVAGRTRSAGAGARAAEAASSPPPAVGARAGPPPSTASSAPASGASETAVFDGYSRYYDLLYADKDYRAEAEYVHRLLERHGVRGARAGGPWLLELGSGTGRHASHLHALGHRVDGVERSPTMLERASALEVPGAVAFHRGDIREVRLGRTYDAAISLFHVMSYLPTNADWTAALTTARAHLEPGGLFVFDAWYGPAVLTDRPTVRAKRMADEEIEVTRVAEPVLHAESNHVDVRYQVFVRAKRTGAVEELSELHRMRYVFTPEVAELLDRTGFELAHAEEWMTGRAPDFDTWGVCFVARAVDVGREGPR